MALAIAVVGMQKDTLVEAAPQIPRKLILALLRYRESAPRRPACLKEQELGAGGIRDQQERKLPDFT